MFKKYLMSFILAWLLIVLGCFGLLYTSSSDAKMAYQDLMNYNNQFKKERQQNHSTQQKRYQVSKQILYQKGEHRMQSRLAGESSDLIYSKKDGELVEHFKDLTCVMQEEFMKASNSEEKKLSSSPSKTDQQMIRQFKAKEAVYFYKSGQLEAKEVKVADYVLPGQLWPNSIDIAHPLIQGQAQTIQLSLFKEPNLKAQGFQAILHDWRDEW